MAQAGLSSLAQNFRQLSNAQKIGFLAALAAVIAVVAVAFLWARQPEYKVLYSGLSDRDGGEVVAALSQLNVPYKVAEGGSVILVPAQQVYDVRLKLAAQGLPKGGAVGFELMETQKFGISQFAEQVNYQRALAGELARTIQALSNVQSARVHLAIPRPSVFVREAQQPSASVLVTLYPGRLLDAGQVSAITHLVASSVPELSARSVTVVDQAGNLLSGGPQSEAVNGLDATQLKFLHSLEASYVSRIENILKPIVGPDNVRAQVAATLDFNQVEQTSETFRPNATSADQSVRSQQTVETVNTNPQGPSGVPGALSNQPPGAASAPLAASPPAAAGQAQAAAQSVNTHRENTVNYELDKTIRHVKGEVGAVKRLSVAVVVNYRRTVDKDGKAALKPLTEQELAQLSDLAREAMGFSKERGDTLNVVNAPFSGEPLPGVEAPSAWAAWLQEASEPASVIQAAKVAGLVLVVLIAVFGLIRPALRDLSRGPRIEPGGVPRPAGAMLEPQLAGAPAGVAQPEAEAGFEADLRAVKELAKQEPRIVANVVKDWVGRNE
jgi:flagellar M-ring protein FliF